MHQQAKDDLIDHYPCIARDEPVAADQLLAAAQKLFDDLAHFPDLGRR
jgi:plasmid stabilization system protein ParE